MNYLAHALPFRGRPYFVAGTSVPDWLQAADRRCRVRSKHAEPLCADADRATAAVAGGIVQHLRDDKRFHETRAFAETSLELTTAVRDFLGAESGFRPSFLGHLLTEVLLDAALAAEDATRLEAYYDDLGAIDPAAVERVVNRIAARPTGRLALLIARFREHRVLFDYLDDTRLAARVNQVLGRVGMERLPAGFVSLLAEARRAVAARRDALLEGIPVR